ncbi:MAG: hypothetical protein WC050_00685 [Candidatus Paceibacterota bacterium]
MRREVYRALKKVFAGIPRTERTSEQHDALTELFQYYDDEVSEACRNIKSLDETVWYIAGILVGLGAITDAAFDRMRIRAFKLTH